MHALAAPTTMVAVGAPLNQTGTLAAATETLAQSPLGSLLLTNLQRSGGTITVVDDTNWRQLGYPEGVVAATTGAEIAINGRLLADPRAAALLIGHEATHVFDVTSRVFEGPGDVMGDMRHAADTFARAGFSAHEGAIWGLRGSGVQWELVTEAHAYRNQAIIARELGMTDAGSAVGRGGSADGRIFTAQEAVAALQSDPAYVEAYGAGRSWALELARPATTFVSWVPAEA